MFYFNQRDLYFALEQRELRRPTYIEIFAPAIPATFTAAAEVRLLARSRCSVCDPAGQLLTQTGQSVGGLFRRYRAVGVPRGHCSETRRR